jgi:hypothetical protein
LRGGDAKPLAARRRYGPPYFEVRHGLFAFLAEVIKSSAPTHKKLSWPVYSREMGI